jgi:hypothetical protein
MTKFTPNLSHNEIHFNAPITKIKISDEIKNNCKEKIQENISHSTIYSSVRISLYEIFNGYYIPADNGGKIITNSSGVMVHNQINNIYDSSIDTSKKSNLIKDDSKIEFISGVLVDLTSAGSALFSFWLLDALPKLMLVEMHGIKFQPKLSILVNQKSRFVIETLNLFGFSNANLIIRNGVKAIFKADIILCPRPIRERRYTPYWALEYIRNKYDIKNTVNPLKRIYISRNRSSGRRVINEDELSSYLSKSGFDILYAEEHSSHSFSQMIEGASIIISPHGAGLANIIFASKGSNIIELFGAHYTDQYQLLALELGQKYIKIACISEDGLYRNEYSRSSHSIADLNRKSFSVDVNEIAKIVETIDSSFNV